MSRITAHEWPHGEGAEPDDAAVCRHCGNQWKRAKTLNRPCVPRDADDGGKAMRPEPARREYACEAFPEIWASLTLIRAYERRECWKRASRDYRGCWCYMACDDGGSLPCPPETATGA